MSNEQITSEEHLKIVEAKLLEQEHRPTHLVLNFWRRKRKWPDPEDPRRKATQKALIWRLLFSPAVMAVGGSSIVAILTLFYLNKQTDVMDHQTLVMEQQTKVVEKQNQLLSEQNKKIEIQANLEEAGRRSSLVLLMDNILQQVGEELKESKDSMLSEPLIARISALSQGFQPYKFLDYNLRDQKGKDSLGLTNKYSPERGQLLLALANTPINEETIFKIYKSANFSYSYLKYANLKEANLGGADLRGSWLIDSDLTKADLKNSDLMIVGLRDSDLRNSDLRGANLFGADLRDAYLLESNLSYANLHYANLSGAELNDADLSNTILSFVDFRDTDLSGVKLNNIRNLNNAIVDRKDWLIYIKDSLILEGADVLNRKYYVSPWNEEKEWYLILKKEE